VIINLRLTQLIQWTWLQQTKEGADLQAKALLAENLKIMLKYKWTKFGSKIVVYFLFM